MPYVHTRAGRVFYAQSGAGVPVVLLHATLHDHHDFDVVAGALSSRYRTIAIDWPNHGASESRSPGSITATVLADVLVDVVRELDLESAVFVGNSVGGYAAARLALDHPDRVAGLVLVNTGGFTAHGPKTWIATRLLGMPSLNRRLGPRLVQRYMSPRGESDRRIRDDVGRRAGSVEGAKVSATLWRSFGDRSFDLRAAAARVKAPTLVVWGMRDAVFPPAAARQTHAAIPGSQLHTFDTGHVVFASDPAGFLDAVLPFVDSCRQRS